MNKQEIKAKLKANKEERKELKRQLKGLDVFKNNDWIKLKGNDNILICISDYENEKAYGIDAYGNWFNDILDNAYNGWTFKSNPDEWIKATAKEVQDALTKEAEKRGYGEGVSFLGVAGVQKNELITISENQPINFGFPNSTLGLYCENSWIFRNGKWAEIIEQPKTVELNGNYTKVDLTDIINNRF